MACGTFKFHIPFMVNGPFMVLLWSIHGPLVAHYGPSPFMAHLGHIHGPDGARSQPTHGLWSIHGPLKVDSSGLSLVLDNWGENLDLDALYTNFRPGQTMDKVWTRRKCWIQSHVVDGVWTNHGFQLSQLDKFWLKSGQNWVKTCQNS